MRRGSYQGTGMGRYNEHYYGECSSYDSSSVSKYTVSDLTERFTSALNNLKLFFASRNLKTSTTTANRSSIASSAVSSGYGSLDSSWELDDSYIKVSKFSDTEESGEFGHYGAYKEYKEMAMQQRIASEIKTIVENNSQHRIKISDYLTLRTANDVLNLCKCEPCGLKGCKLIVMVQTDNDVILRRSTYPEKGMLCTFEITLVLHVKKQHFRFFDDSYTIMEVYELRKEKLYTSRHRKGNSWGRRVST